MYKIKIMKKIIALFCFAAFTTSAMALPVLAAKQGFEISNFGDKDKDKDKKAKGKKSKESCVKAEGKSCCSKTQAKVAEKK